MIIRSAAALLGLCLTLPAFAQTEADADQAVRALIDGLPFRQGAIAVAEANARFELGTEFRYLEQAGARTVLENLWGNPPDDTVLGLIVPSTVDLADDASWAVVVTYSDDGYVSDEDAKEIDYNELLESMQSDTADANDARREAGYPTIDLRGWAESPHYDASSHKLYWAKDLVFDGQHSGLNYDVRVLGRHGYLSLNAVASVEQLDTVRDGMQQLLPRTDFDEGFRYADYDASSDHVAAYGLAALVGGGLAAKSGLLGKLFVMLLAAKKIVLPLLIGLGMLVVKLFRRNKAA